MAAAGDIEPFGIVTLADVAYFPGLELLYRSVEESWPLPVACFDAGLTDAQKCIAGNYPLLRILPLPATELLAGAEAAFRDAPAMRKPNKRVWPLWVCPDLIAAAPYRQVFWMDCDIVVLRNLRDLFALLEKGPVFTPEINAPEATPNKPELYSLLPIESRFDPREPRVNAGVSGWDLVRDAPVLAAYRHAAMQACKNVAIRQAISWHDQGALIWAIQKTGMEDRVVDSWAWNFCVKHTSLARSPLPCDADLLPALRRMLPGINVLHWNGFEPPWPGDRNHQ